jgi:hypothetical protein
VYQQLIIGCEEMFVVAESHFHEPNLKFHITAIIDSDGFILSGSDSVAD